MYDIVKIFVLFFDIILYFLNHQLDISQIFEKCYSLIVEGLEITCISFIKEIYIQDFPLKSFWYTVKIIFVYAMDRYGALRAKVS